MLNTEQIEIQRRKFESVKPVPYFLEYNKNGNFYALKDDGFTVECDRYNYFWSCWLLCVESNEIELPKQYVFNYPSGVRKFYYKPQEVVSAIEAQGFMVKV